MTGMHQVAALQNESIKWGVKLLTRVSRYHYSSIAIFVGKIEDFNGISRDVLPDLS